MNPQEALQQFWTGQVPPHSLAETLQIAHALSPVPSPLALLAGQTPPEIPLPDPETQAKYRADSGIQMMEFLGAIL